MRDPHAPHPELLLSPEHPCPYLAGRAARTQFVDPRVSAPLDYNQLLSQGFRRSGAYVYRPHCQGCNACIALRIPVHEFQPDRSQRRTWKRNRNLGVHVIRARYREEHYALYLRYQRWKHLGGGMDQSSPEDYANFLVAPSGETVMAEIRLQRELLAVAVMDLADDALSAVYTFYTPDQPRRSLGTYSILWEIAAARRRGLRWLYLGYWIAASPEMAYKNRFVPHELLTGNGWQRIARTAA